MAEIKGSATAGIGGQKVRAGIDVQGVIALAIILLFLAWLAYQLATRITDNGDLNTPPRQPADERDGDMSGLMAGLNPLDGSVKHAQVCEPHQHYRGYRYLPHRYPRTVGGELTNTIHHGFSSMRLPAASDVALWMANPPSEVAW
jgi:hypothetical protein